MPVKKSDIHYSSATFVPVADCLGELDDDDDNQALVMCTWTWRPTGWGSKSGAAKDAAKNHVQVNPAHVVTVTAKTVSEYWVPKGCRPA